MTTYLQSWYQKVNGEYVRMRIIFEAENDNEARKKAVFPHKDVYFAQLGKHIEHFSKPSEHIEIKPEPKKLNKKLSKPYYRNERW